MNLQVSTAKQAKIGKFVYVNAGFQKTFKKLVDSIVYSTHCNLLVGPPGVGKTLMLHRVIDILGASIQPFYFEKSYTDFDDLVEDMIQTLNLDFESGQMLKRLENYFDGRKKGSQPIALFIDNVGSYEEQAFSQLLSFIEIVSQKKNAPSVILSGQTALLDDLGSSRASQFRKNIGTDHCELHPLPSQEIGTYINRRLKHLGLGGKVLFSDAAVSKIANYSKGIPATINRLCYGAISVHSDSTTRKITGELIEQVAARDVPASFVEDNDPPLSVDIPLLGTVAPLLRENPEDSESMSDSGIANDKDADELALFADQHDAKDKPLEGNTPSDAEISDEESFVDVPLVSEGDPSKNESSSWETPETLENVDSDSAEVPASKSEPEPNSRKLEDVLASVYYSNSFVPSAASSKNNGSDSEADIKQQVELVPPVKASEQKTAGDSQAEETQILPDQAGEDTIGRLSDTFELSNQAPAHQISSNGEILDVNASKPKRIWRTAVGLLPLALLIAALAILSYNVMKKRELQFDSPNQSANGNSTESESIADKQDVGISDIAGFERSVLDPRVEEAPILDGQEDSVNQQSFSELRSKNGQDILERTRLNVSQNGKDKKGFATETELLGMKDMGKWKGDGGYRHSILIDASKEGYAKAVDQLLEYGYDVNARGEYGDTALIWAVINNHLETVQVLLERGADFTISNKSGGTAMSSAIHNGSIPIVEALLNAGANPHATDEKNRTTLVVAAAQEDPNKELVERLMVLGVNIDAASQNGRTALMNAAEKGNDEIVRILLNKHADVSMTDKNGESAAEIAGKAGFDPIAKLIAAAGEGASKKD